MYTVTFVQLAPPSRVTCTCPSSVPTQMTFGSFVDGVIRMTALKVSAPELSFTTGPPDDCCLLLSFSTLPARDGWFTLIGSNACSRSHSGTASTHPERRRPSPFHVVAIVSWPNRFSFPWVGCRPI